MQTPSMRRHSRTKDSFDVPPFPLTTKCREGMIRPLHQLTVDLSCERIWELKKPQKTKFYRKHAQEFEFAVQIVLFTENIFWPTTLSSMHSSSPHTCRHMLRQVRLFKILTIFLCGALKQSSREFTFEWWNFRASPSADFTCMWNISLTIKCSVFQNSYFFTRGTTPPPTHNTCVTRPLMTVLFRLHSGDGEWLAQRAKYDVIRLLLITECGRVFY